MINFIVIYKVKKYSDDYSSLFYNEHVELADVQSVERFINTRLRYYKWMKPSDFIVYSCRRANILNDGKPIQDAIGNISTNPYSPWS